MFEKAVDNRFETNRQKLKSPEKDFTKAKGGMKDNLEELEEINTNLKIENQSNIRIRTKGNNYENSQLENYSTISINDLSINNNKLLENKNKILENNSKVYDLKLCPICLEFLDLDRTDKPYIINFKSIDSPVNLGNKFNSINYFINNSSGLISMLCGHTFHIECSLKFEDEKCPICRYYISPISISTCSLCTNEDDLWICLICGNIYCGAEGNEHRKQHYIDVGHVYAKKIGEPLNITFDLSRNTNLNSWFQHTIYNNFNPVNHPEEKGINNFISLDNENHNNSKILKDSSVLENKNIFYDKNESSKVKAGENTENGFSSEFLESDENKKKLLDQFPNFSYSKNSKDKLDFIISEYNSIISSQLESQRFFFLNKIRNLEEKYTKKVSEIDKEIEDSEKELKNLKIENEASNHIKLDLLKILKENEIAIKNKLEDYSQNEMQYNCLLIEKNNLTLNQHNKEKFIKEEINKIDEEIKMLKNEMKDLKVHIELKKIKKIQEISGGSVRTLEFKTKKPSGQRKNSK